MSATSFDVRTFNRRSGDVANALLATLDVKDLELREEAVAEREVEVTRREREIDAVERMHELRANQMTAATSVPVASAPSDRSAERVARRQAMQAFRIRERDWWTKVLGIVPTLQ